MSNPLTIREKLLLMALFVLTNITWFLILLSINSSIN